MEPLTAPELAILDKARLVCDLCDALEANDSFVIDDQKLSVCKKCHHDLKDTVITPTLPLYNIKAEAAKTHSRGVTLAVVASSPPKPAPKHKESASEGRRRYIREHCVHCKARSEWALDVSCAVQGNIPEELCDYMPGASWSCKSFEAKTAMQYVTDLVAADRTEGTGPR